MAHGPTLATGGNSDTAQSSGRIRVAVRVRPFSVKEKETGARCIITMANNQTKILDPAYFDAEEDLGHNDERSMWERTFTFDNSFWSGSLPSETKIKGSLPSTALTEQADVYCALGEFLVDNACKGFNCSLFAYGQTGSGKTYTMLGDSSDLQTAAGPGRAGIIPRLCVELFQRFNTEPNTKDRPGMKDLEEASVEVSFCEIYNEQVRDLFTPSEGHGLRVREHPSRGAFVEGLSAKAVKSYGQVQALLELGMASRVTAATAMNEVSSRSHAIFTINVKATVRTKAPTREGKSGIGRTSVDQDTTEEALSKICLVDLAGSERANSTGAKGDRLREAANINKSLSTLGDV
ncbi:unnamed protein product, partial [Choristocarpus tenellus]